MIQFNVDVSEKNCFIFLLAEVALGCHQRLDRLVYLKKNSVKQVLIISLKFYKNGSFWDDF